MYSGGDLMNIQEKEQKGVSKKVDALGRITIPKMWRQLIGIEEKGNVIVFLIDENTIGIKVAN